MRLPEGWCAAGADKAAALHAEYRTALPDDHPLAGVAVRVIAYREGSDDILVEHRDHPGQVSVVHLSWIGHQEMPGYPRVEFSGSHEAFIVREHALYG